MKAKKLSKVVLSFALAAALLAEPLAGMPIVYAEETQAEDRFSEENEGSDGITADNQEDSDESIGQNESEDSDKENGENIENSPQGESEEGKEDSTEEESEEDKEDGSREESDDQSEEGTDEVIDAEQDTDEETEESEEAEADIEEDEQPETDLGDFSDMPSGYQLTSAQKELKADLSDTLNQLSESDEGVTYAERQIFTFADSQEDAEMIAKAYHAEIIDFQMGVLTMKLNEGSTVKSALIVAADLDNSLPAVWPNYSRRWYGEIGLSAEDGSISNPEVVEEYEQVSNGTGVISDEYLDPASAKYQWFHTTIGSSYAWDAGYQGQSVKVGVIDTGISSNPDLDDNVFDRMDFCDGTSDAADIAADGGHGTHIAGIIAALGNNGQGVGVAPKAQIFNARVFGVDEEKSGYDSTVIEAINYLIGEENNGTNKEIDSTPARVDIINMSFGGPGFSSAFQFVLDKAYKKGVIVFASTGNDGGSLTMYPASFNHVIAVAATDVNNQRAYFSNYGTTTDLAAPGVNIYSTTKVDSGDTYGALQGSSIACPVAAGEAAVILSGQDALPALKGKTGKARVNAVESLMKNNTISAGSGMGKGITSLPKVFQLSTAAAKPNAPTITAKLSDNKQSVEVTITAQAGMKLCYTVNGKNPSLTNGEPDDNTILVESNTTVFSLDCNEAAKGTVKAFAINESGAIGPVKSYTYKLSPYVKDIEISGSRRVEQGKSVQLAATVTPTYAANQKVTWEIKTAAGTGVDTTKIKIDQKGKVTAAKNADLGDYQVIVTAQDEQGKASDPYTIQVVAAGASIQSLTFDKNVNKELWIAASESNPALSLASVLTAAENVDGQLQEINGIALGDRVVWTSSKPAVAAVDSSGTVTANATGTTTITVKANDSGNKKATINITVKQAVTGITITTDKGETDDKRLTVAAGKSMTLKAGVEPAKPANKKVIWSLENEKEANEAGVSINKSSGKITVAAGTKTGEYTVTAAAADGQGAKAQKVVKVYGGAIGKIKLDTTKAKLYTQVVDASKTNTITINATITGAGDEPFNPNAYTVTSSKPSIVTAAAVTSSTGAVITIRTTGDGYGKANVMIASTDGSNKKATCAVTVSGGITKAEWINSDDGKKFSKQSLFRSGIVESAPDKITINAKLTGSDGANLSKYAVSSSNTSLVSVEEGKATVDTNTATIPITLTTSSKFTGKATITLMATDGSKKKATCTITVCNPPSKINIAPKNGTTRYVVPGKSVQMTAALETEYGAVSNKKVTWSLPESATRLGITVNASGKISVPANLTVSKHIDYQVTATAKDGSGVSATGTFYLAPPTTYIKVGELSGGNGVYKIPISSDCTAPMSCTSSSPKVASPTIVYTAYDPVTKKGGTGYIAFVCTQKGTATFTIKAMDGSGKQYKYTIQAN